MQTQTIIKDTTAVARVTALEEGDAYRRLVPKTAYSEAKMTLGIVTGVMNNGETVALTALEIEGSFGSSKVVEKVFEADSDLVLFPVDDDEARVILSEARRDGERAIASAERALIEAKDKFYALERLADRIASAQNRLRATDQIEG